MEIRPIRTVTDYEQALDQIAALFTAEPQTPEGDILSEATSGAGDAGVGPHFR